MSGKKLRIYNPEMRYTFLRIVMINLWNRFPRIIIFPLLEVLEWCLALCSVYWFYVYSVCVYKIECLSSMDYISEAAFAPGNSCLVILGVKLDDQAMKWVCLVGKEFNLFFSEKTLFNLGDWSVSATHSLWQYLLFLSSLEMKVRHIELVQCALPLRVMSCCPSCDLCYLCPFCHLCHLCPSYVILWWKKMFSYYLLEMTTVMWGFLILSTTYCVVSCTVLFLTFMSSYRTHA